MSEDFLKAVVSRGLDQTNGLPWAEQIKQRNFEQALSLVEVELEQLPECVGTRLWWVRCQLELERLPITALTSPLEEIAEKLKTIPELFSLACSTFLRLGQLLADRNQSRLSLVMIERAREFSDLSNDLDEQEQRALSGALKQALAEEINRAELRRENKKYISSLLEKQANEEKRVPQKVKNSEKPKKKERAKALSAKTVIAAATAEAQNDGEESQVQESWQIGSAQVENRENFPTIPQARPSGQSSRSLFTFLGLLVLAGLAFYYSWERIFASATATIDSRLAIRLSPPFDLNLSTPQLKAVSAAKSSLDEVGKRIQKLTLTKKEQKPATSEEPKKEKEPEIDRDALNPANASALVKQQRAKEDELISMSGPDSMRNDIRENKVPRMDPEKFAKTKVEELSTSPRRAPVDESGPGGERSYGGSPAQQPPIQQERALDGSPLRSYAVNQFNPPLRYRTLTATEVLSSPSLLASSLARLEQNTPVDVTAKMGQWLELRSTAGRTGYIYAQDAVEEKTR